MTSNHSLTIRDKKTSIDFTARPPSRDELAQLASPYGRMKVQGILIVFGTGILAIAGLAMNAMAPLGQVNAALAVIVAGVGLTAAFVGIRFFAPRMFLGAEMWEALREAEPVADKAKLEQLWDAADRIPELGHYLAQVELLGRKPVMSEISAALRNPQEH